MVEDEMMDEMDDLSNDLESTDCATLDVAAGSEVPMLVVVQSVVVATGLLLTTIVTGKAAYENVMSRIH
jgi:hypothetical protein